MGANTIIVFSLLALRSEIFATYLFDYLFIVCDHNDGLMYGLICILNNQKCTRRSFHSTIYTLLLYLVYPLLQPCLYFFCNCICHIACLTTRWTPPCSYYAQLLYCVFFCASNHPYFMPGLINSRRDSANSLAQRQLTEPCLIEPYMIIINNVNQNFWSKSVFYMLASRWSSEKFF